MSSNSLWFEAYRPKTIKDCVLPSATKKIFQSFVDLQTIPNLLLFGTSGTGKTTAAKALCDQINCDWIMINGSEDTSIDVVRTKIRNFASTVSFSGGLKVIIYDEFDNVSSATALALRGMIEEFASSCRFIFTCNYKDKVIPAIHSRCSVIDFKIPKAEKVEIAQGFHASVAKILNAENVKYDENVLRTFIAKHFPDFRRVINELQGYSSVNQKIDEGIFAKTLGDVTIKELVVAMKNKDFQAARKWVALNSDQEFSRIARTLYDALNEYLDPKSIPQAILHIANYQYKSAFCADAEINNLAAIIEIMSDCKFKGE